ncbi:cytochrome C oxidase subunit III [Pseudoroseomonas deserti]|uniref:Cytochrome C oxidase subunit III n=1 Tax=Teichococcus deserti TaxID=1817963 RepID=A0A1V2H2B9_9PROT|nr:cytochrome c oxidase subunit 3 [Pseudoroseomonas deserti]ONG53555.1 cytochrome C oxidase subunit III [Pseudoroseomonas deserti]
MQRRAVLDLSRLPEDAPSSGSLTWWGTLAFMLIEGTGFALAVAVYLYLGSLDPGWRQGAPPPAWGPGLGVTLLLLASLVPNLLLMRWARAGDLKRTRLGLLLMAGFGTAPLLLRIFEFAAFGVSWDDSAYGSAVWLLLGLHTTHILTDLVETYVLCFLFFTRHGDHPRRYGDVQDGALYWYFVVLTWLPIFGCLYGLPRL